MKMMKKLFIGLLTLTLVLGFTISALAAIEVKPGKSFEVSFSIKSVYSVDGYFEFSNKDLFSRITYSVEGKLDGKVTDNRVYLYGSEESDATIVISGVIDSNAKADDSCDIKFTYETADINGDMSDWKTMTKTVKVKEIETTKAPETTTTKAPATTTTKAAETTKPTQATPEVDYTELKRQIGIATSLNENEYTIDSWNNMAAALEKANELLTSNSQAEVDAGAQALADAIAALVKIDFTELQKAIAKGRGLMDTCAHGDLWWELFDLINESDTVMKSRDQAKVDELTAKINDVIDRILKDCPNCGETKIVEVPVVSISEVPVEPNDPYCNIKMHKIWPILFFIALGLLIILSGLILWFFLRRRNNERDDTPLVDYDPSDDVEPNDQDTNN